MIGTVGTSVAALYFFPRGELLVGTLVICLFVFSDSLDGTMARLAGRPSTWGAFLDSTLDRVADAAIFCGLALWFAGDGDDPTMAAVTLAALVGGLLVSYARARAEGLGADAQHRDRRADRATGADARWRPASAGSSTSPWILEVGLGSWRPRLGHRAPADLGGPPASCLVR